MNVNRHCLALQYLNALRESTTLVLLHLYCELCLTTAGLWCLYTRKGWLAMLPTSAHCRHLLELIVACDAELPSEAQHDAIC